MDDLRCTMKSKSLFHCSFPKGRRFRLEFFGRSPGVYIEAELTDDGFLGVIFPVEFFHVRREGLDLVFVAA